MDSEDRKNILIVTLSNIGDVILTTPVIASLRSQFPQAQLTVVVGPKAEGILEGSVQIDRLLIYDKRAGWAHRFKLVRQLRENSYDWVIDLRNSGFPFFVRATRRSSVFRFHRMKQARERHLEILQWMKLSNDFPLAFDFFSKEDEDSLSEKLRKKSRQLSSGWVVMAPGAGSKAKRWKIEGFCEVADRILETSSFYIAVVGDSSEKLLGAKVAEIDSNRVLNLAGEISLRELAALVARAKLVLSNDSAVMHLGYELNRSVVAVFGPTDHEKYGRENKMWKIVRDPAIERIAPQKVFEACSELLNRIPQV